jgi:hypothetical protein
MNQLDLTSGCFFDPILDHEATNMNSENFSEKPDKKIIYRRIKRELIGAEKTKKSLKEAISFKHIKIEELMHSYVDFDIKDKQLYVVLDCIELVLHSSYFIFERKHFYLYSNFILRRSYFHLPERIFN